MENWRLYLDNLFPIQNMFLARNCLGPVDGINHMDDLPRNGYGQADDMSC
jgi:hypothetical protein